MNTSDTDSLDINDPELIKFMNEKMNNNKSVTMVDLFLDLMNYAIDTIIVEPCNYIYNYIATNIDFNDLFIQFKTTMLLDQYNSQETISEETVTEPVTETEPKVQEEAEPDHVLVENQTK
jgi:hypothetical protein